ncbi:MAG: 3-dehydroquinate synthase [Bacteroidota bacterium]
MKLIKSGTYSITIGHQALKNLSAFLAKSRYSSLYILCDENTLQFCLPTLVISCKALAQAQVIEIESGESSKSMEFSAQVLQTLAENNADKKALLINLGGGVVSDLGGFSASVYKRGIDFINVPTSLLAMADASVGGKTGIDFAGVKNLVGTFAQPKAVYIYPEFLKTLPQRHFINGLAEIYKIALVSDLKFWNELKDQAKTTDPETLIAKSVSLKNKIVSKDPFDHGIRKILNFGHTIGHAIESLLLGSESELLHGEAVLRGMIIESHLAFQKKLITKKALSEISSVLLSAFKPQILPDLSIQAVTDLIRNDKKTTGNKSKFSLPVKIGACSFDVEATEQQIQKAFLYYQSLYNDKA